MRNPSQAWAAKRRWLTQRCCWVLTNWSLGEGERCADPERCLALLTSDVPCAAQAQVNEARAVQARLKEAQAPGDTLG